MPTRTCQTGKFSLEDEKTMRFRFDFNLLSLELGYQFPFLEIGHSFQIKSNEVTATEAKVGRFIGCTYLD